MPLATELMGLGLAPAVAQDLGVIVATGLSGAGSTQTDATSIGVNTFNVFSTVAASTGARLPVAGGNGNVVVVNGGANALTVYPATGESINALSANTGLSVAAGRAALFLSAGNRWAGLVSA
ncbi:MAG: hypothetical protein INF12_14620 [Methylobacterium sp.]|nr:hypothetical protein [Methylobacterium sp.]